MVNGTPAILNKLDFTPRLKPGVTHSLHNRFSIYLFFLCAFPIFGAELRVASCAPGLFTAAAFQSKARGFWGLSTRGDAPGYYISAFQADS